MSIQFLRFRFLVVFVLSLLPLQLAPHHQAFGLDGETRARQPTVGQLTEEQFCEKVRPTSFSSTNLYNMCTVSGFISGKILSFDQDRIQECNATQEDCLVKVGEIVPECSDLSAEARESFAKSIRGCNASVGLLGRCLSRLDLVGKRIEESLSCSLLDRSRASKIGIRKVRKLLDNPPETCVELTERCPHIFDYLN